MQERLELTGLLQHLKFCRQRNRHERDSPNRTVQTNDSNHDNLNNDVNEINDATKSRENNQNENQERFYWNGVASTQFVNELNNAYEKIAL